MRPWLHDLQLGSGEGKAGPIHAAEAQPGGAPQAAPNTDAGASANASPSAEAPAGNAAGEEEAASNAAEVCSFLRLGPMRLDLRRLTDPALHQLPCGSAVDDFLQLDALAYLACI